MRFPFLAILFGAVLGKGVCTSAMKGSHTQQSQSSGVMSRISQFLPGPAHDDRTVIYDFINNEQHSSQSGEPTGRFLPSDLHYGHVPQYNMPYRLFIPSDTRKKSPALFMYTIWVNNAFVICVKSKTDRSNTKCGYEMHEPLQFVGLAFSAQKKPIRSVYLYTQLNGAFMRPISSSSDFNAWTVGSGRKEVKFYTRNDGDPIKIYHPEATSSPLLGDTILYKCWNHDLQVMVISFKNSDGQCTRCEVHLEWVVRDMIPPPPTSIPHIETSVSNPRPDEVSHMREPMGDAQTSHQSSVLRMGRLSVNEDDSLAQSRLPGDPNHDLDMDASDSYHRQTQVIPELASPFHLYVRFGESEHRFYLYLTTKNLNNKIILCVRPTSQQSRLVSHCGAGMSDPVSFVGIAKHNTEKPNEFEIFAFDRLGKAFMQQISYSFGNIDAWKLRNVFRPLFFEVNSLAQPIRMVHLSFLRPKNSLGMRVCWNGLIQAYVLSFNKKKAVRCAAAQLYLASPDDYRRFKSEGQAT